MKLKFSLRSFFNKLLAGTAQGIIIALVPNAIISSLFSYFEGNPLADMAIQAGLIFQIATPLIIGGLIAKQFDLNPMAIMVTAAASFIGSGVIQYDPSIQGYVGAGTGDVINVMITSALAVILLQLIGDKFGSVSVIGLPLVVGIGVGVFGMWLYPGVAQITTTIGDVINTFTELQPILMTVLISCSFALLIISPITTVGVGLAIGLTGLASGAAALGVAATTIVLVVNSWKINESGITIAIALGGMKMMMPNLFKTPIILLPCLFTAAVSGLLANLFNVVGTPQSAGFGLVGLVGPLASIEGGLGIVASLLVWLVVPIIVTLIGQFLFEKVFKLYRREDVFTYQG
ncbi:PTS sugar transporter subunit IIC [Aerococcaceae bacterium 50-4]